MGAATVSLNMHVAAHHGVARIGLVGEVDLAAKPQLQAEIGSQVSDPTIERIVVDLSGVIFLDSAGIGALVGGKRFAADAGKHVQVIGALGQVADVLEIVGVAAFLAH
jgi:anti-anti-sigma factor